MPNQFALAGAQPQKQTKFAAIYSGRWSTGLWTNRSPLRDANTTRLTEKFYGAAGDALIDGSNTEITNRLTLARRPGNTLFDGNTYTAVDRFYDFRLFSSTAEQIDVMVDQADALYSLYNAVKSRVWTKQPNAGQSSMQSVGNSLYWGDGVSNKKWLQSLTTWNANAEWNTPTTPFLSTFLIDSNGNIQQLTGTAIPVVSTSVASNVLTVTSSLTLSGLLTAGMVLRFPATMASTFLENQTVTVASVATNSFTATFVHANYSAVTETGVYAAETTGGASPVSGPTLPVWSTTVPSASNHFQGGVTQDGAVQWTNRGNPVMNWGIQPPTSTLQPTVGSSRVAWQKNTFYSPAGVILDANGNLQQVTTAGVSGTAAPAWATTLGATTTDGTVTWTLLQLAASLTWTAHTSYPAGTFIVGNAAGTNCLFRAKAPSQPSLNSTVSAYMWPEATSGAVGCFQLQYPQTTGSAIASATGLQSLWFTGNPISWKAVNGAGESVSTSAPFTRSTDYQLVITTTINVPAAGQYTFNIAHHDGLIWGMGAGATLVSGTDDNPINPKQTRTVVNGYPVFGGTNRGLEGGGLWNDTFTVDFPTAGTYPVELNYSFWYHSGQQMHVQCNGFDLGYGPAESGTTQPIWPAWSTGYAPAYPTVNDANGIVVWENLGPVADFAWSAKTQFTTANTSIIDPASNKQSPYRTGVTGTTAPAFATGLNQLTTDNPNLIWINTGVAPAPPAGTVSTYNGGWVYSIALVNTLDNTVSNATPISAATGNFIGAANVLLAPGAGLPPASKIDPQCDYVAIFRSTDGLATPFLIPGKTTTYTTTLADYLVNGYTDNTPDTGLNNLISAPIAGENTPPGTGAQNLTFHLNRIFFSIGNTVYWTAGPDTPCGNGVNGVPPLNYDNFPSLVKRIVPTTSGAMVFTVSDVYLIQGAGTASNPIQSGIPVMQGVGLLNYNALDVNGSIIGFFTTDRQFCILDPSAGVSYAGFPIGDRFRQNNGNPGQSWDPASVYVTWHVEGEDQGWYVSDGVYGWYRLVPTPAPESGYTWSPFARIVGGAKSVQSVEVSPGVHKLLLGPIGDGSILQRNVSSSQDNGQNYPAWAVIGSAVLAQPGQVAEVSFVTTESVNTGTPLTIGLLLDEALPYYTGPFDVLKDSVPDPPGLARSRSLLGQRFYLDSLRENAAVCRHMQIKVQWADENAANELLSLTVYGGYLQEQ